ncbi:hypothetical protein RvY_07691 [Ramazzottius varieornatus]|uniref:Uncharacterized protein n=1 Tax=Ramazzottius varieornatus TaxID=947166 RepID=A0A1D1V640_RAMVA|nr:hypothetical protein RvY_07691 [Ramazzottius varieornatus]
MARIYSELSAIVADDGVISQISNVQFPSAAPDSCKRHWIMTYATSETQDKLKKHERKWDKS